MRRAGSSIAAVLLAIAPACGDDAIDVDGGRPDGGAIDAGDDAGSGGLRVLWHASPTPPGEVTGALSLDDVHLSLRELRVVGDAGDASAISASLDWEAGVTPSAVRFASAPPGLYSRLEFRLDGGGEHAYEMRGMVHLNDQWFPYEIEDERPLSVSVELEVTLGAGQEEIVGVAVNFGDVMERIDWSEAELEKGVLTLEEEHLDALREALVEAFEVEE